MSKIGGGDYDPEPNGDTPAFPSRGNEGLTKREYIAAMIFARSGNASAKAAVDSADALLAELEKQRA